MNRLGQVARLAVRQMQPLVPSDRNGVSILSYHLVGASTSSVVDLPSDAFRAQLHELRNLAHVYSLDDAVAHLTAGIALTQPAVVVTFDDAFDNFRTHAWPLLHELKIPCTLYVPVGFVDGTSGSPLKGAEGLRPIHWNALRELACEPLLTVGSHSWGHADMRRLPAEALRTDLRRSREVLQERTGLPVDHFCYPQAKWSRRVEEEVFSVYRTAAVAGGRKNVPRGGPLRRLSRTPVRRDMPVRLASVVRSTLWLEEWAASCVRLLA